MTTRIAIATTSGSSGKTTTTCALAAICAERGQRVLVIDCDWQMDATRWLQNPEAAQDGRLSLLSVMLDRTSIRAAIAPSNITGVDLLAAAPEMQHSTAQFIGKVGVENQLRLALDKIARRYDVILMDGRAGVGIASLSAIIAAQHIIGVILPGVKELFNLRALDQFVAAVADGYGVKPRLDAVIPCAVPRTGAAYHEALALAESIAGQRLLAPVRHSVGVVEARGRCRPITALKRWQAVADDYRAVTDQLTERRILPASTGQAA